MARKLNEIQLMLDGQDFVKQFVSDLRKDVKALGGDDAMVYEAIKSSSNLRKEFAKLIVAAKNGAKTILHITANLSLADRIARGEYDWANPEITEEHFPTNVPGEYDAEYKLFHFNRTISSEDAIKEMEREGYRPGTLVELLALGEAQPKLQTQFPIVALGSVWRNPYGSYLVPALSWSDGRGLGFLWFGSSWGAGFRFLAVRK